MESSKKEFPWNMNQGDPRKALKRFNSFLTKRHFLRPPDHVLIVRIVSKPLPDLGERTAGEDPLEPEAEGSNITKSADGGERESGDNAPKPEAEESSTVKNADGGRDFAIENALKLQAEGSGALRNSDECLLNTEAEGSSILKNGDVNSLQPDDTERILAEDSQKPEEEDSSLVKNIAADGGEGNAAENSLRSEAERSSVVKNTDIEFLQPNEREGIPKGDSLKHEAEGSSVIKNSNQAPHATYISRQSKGVHFPTDGDDSTEEIINVNSKILSEKSDMFFKLFNEIKSEPEAQSLNIQIEASEEEAFGGLLEFIYFSTLSPSSYTEIVNLLMISDEFQVFSCAESCIRLLEKNIEWALSCCDLSARVHELYLRELLIKVAKEQKSKICSDIRSHKDELLQLSIDKIKALLCMDTLKVESEDVIYDFIWDWVQTHYPSPEDRCSAKELHLEHLIRFPYLTWQKLEEALQCDIFDRESIFEAVNQALAFKVRAPYCRRLTPGGFCSGQFLERCYERTPVMVSRIRSPAFDRCMVYFSLTENEMLEMYPVGRRESEDFMFGRQVFSLVASCKWDRERHYFGLSVTAKGDCSDVIVYAIRLLVMSKANDREEFQETDTGSINVANNVTFGCEDLLPGIWEQLLSGNCPFLLGGILHLCIEITYHQQDES